MNVAGLARAIGLTLASVVLAVSGLYVIVDLARWEWNRAMLSALVFVAALVVIVAMVVMRQIRRLDERVTAIGERRRETEIVRRSLDGPSRGRAAHRFHWLETPPDRLGVFIPVLLGAGVIVSFLTYVIERIAGAVASTTVDRITVRELRTDLPLGDGLIEDSGSQSAQRTLRPASLVVVGVVSVILSVILVVALRELTQTRPGEVTTPGRSTIVVGIEQRRTADPPDVVAGGLWGACRSRLPGGIAVVSIASTGPDEATIVIDHSLGRTGRLRIVGCLEDHTMDLVRAEVRQVTTAG